MGRSLSVRRWSLLWLSFVIFGVVPVGLVLHRGQAKIDPYVALEAEAAGKAQAIDARLERWIERMLLLAKELSSLLAQLPDGSIGTAAEGTLMLYLQRRLGADAEIGEYSMLSTEGRVLLSTDGTRVGTGGSGFPEVAQAAEGPAVALLESTAGLAHVVVGAPVRVGRTLRGVIVGRLQSEMVQRLIVPSQPSFTVDLVDGSGHSLTGRSRGAELLDLGSESQKGRRLLPGDRPAAYVPLNQVRGVIVVIGPPRPASHRGQVLLWVGLAVLMLAAGIGAWLWERGRPQR
jgi:hypothetical protein